MVWMKMACRQVSLLQLGRLVFEEGGGISSREKSSFVCS